MPNTRFDESTKAKAVRLVREHAGDYDSEWAAMCAISSRLGILQRELIRHSVTQIHHPDADVGSGAGSCAGCGCRSGSSKR
jgi:transposase